MNNTFDWNRFKKLVAMDFRGMWPRFGMSMLIITLIPAAIWIFCTVLNLLPNVNIAIPAVARWFFLGTTVFICLIMAPSRMFKTCNLPKDGIYYAMLPASHLEKYISQLLYCVIVCPLMCLVAGFVVDILLTLMPFGVYHEYIWEPIALLSGSYDTDMAAIGEESAEALQLIKFSFSAVILATILSYLSNSATFLFTNTIFKTHKVLKTILILLAISFVLSIIVNPILLHYMVANSDSFENVTPERVVSVYKTLLIVSNVLTAILAAGLFVWTYFRLKRMKY